MLFSAAGYYDYAAGYTPEFEGRETSPADRAPAAVARGPRLHRQEGGRDRQRRDGGDADPGDGRKAAHVTMLQRSPSYVMTCRGKDPIANTLRRVLPDSVAYALTRRMNIARQRFIYKLQQALPASRAPR